jgi:hypothetical protein
VVFARGFDAWFWRVVLARGFGAWFWHVVLARGFGAWFWHVVLARRIGAWYWHVVLVRRFGAVVWRGGLARWFGAAVWLWRVGFGALALARWLWRVGFGALALTRWLWRSGFGADIDLSSLRTGGPVVSWCDDKVIVVSRATLWRLTSHRETTGYKSVSLCDNKRTFYNTLTGLVILSLHLCFLKFMFCNAIFVMSSLYCEAMIFVNFFRAEISRHLSPFLRKVVCKTVASLLMSFPCFNALPGFRTVVSSSSSS